jgi:hypothetical protein
MSAFESDLERNDPIIESTPVTVCDIDISKFEPFESYLDSYWSAGTSRVQDCGTVLRYLLREVNSKLWSALCRKVSERVTVLQPILP